MTNVTRGLTAKKPGSVQCQTLIETTQYLKLFLLSYMRYAATFVLSQDLVRGGTNRSADWVKNEERVCPPPRPIRGSRVAS